MKNTILLLTVVCVSFMLVSCLSNKGKFLLINKATEPISRAVIKVCGQTIELENIPHSEKATALYEVLSDSHFIILVEFESGRIIKKEIGYVTNGINFSHEFIVTDVDISMRLMEPKAL